MGYSAGSNYGQTIASQTGFVDGDDSKITPSVSIDKETIVHQILLTDRSAQPPLVDRYSITLESVSAFTNFEAAINLANTLNTGRVAFNLEQTAKKKVTARVNDGSEYLITLKDIDWDNPSINLKQLT